MKHIYRKPWFRILPIVVLVIFLLVDILRLFTPSGGAAGTGFSTYHDSYYGYTINYPSTWKVMHNPAHTTEFVVPGSLATCQVSINVTRKAMIPQKALLSVVPRGAYSISHKTIDSSPAIAFSQYSSNVQGLDGKFTSASTKKVVVAQANTSHGANLYILSLDMFRAAFVKNKNIVPHTACESDFEVMENSLVLGKGMKGELASIVPNDSSSNPAVSYAETAWNWSDPSGDIYPPLYDQSKFQCAEFVARALAAAGFMNGLDQNSPQSSYTYKAYNTTYYLWNVGDYRYVGDGLWDFLIKIGGVDIGNHPDQASPGDAVFYYDTTDPTKMNWYTRTHVALFISGTTPENSLVTEHNVAELDHSYLPASNGHLGVSIVHMPPPPSLSNLGMQVKLFDALYYQDHTNSWVATSPGIYDIPPGANDNASSIYVPWGWLVIVYRDAHEQGPSHAFSGSSPDLSKVYFDNSTMPIDNQVSSVQIRDETQICRAASIRKVAGLTCGGGNCPNTAAFITDVNFPDGAAVAPGQSFTKTWRLQNTSQSCTWSGFTLNFVSGVQLNGPASVSVPTTGPGQTVDISVPLVAPTNGGTYRGYWQLEDSQGVYVSHGGGGSVWVEIFVPYSSNTNNNGGTNSISASYPSVVTPGQHFQPQVTVTIASGQLLQSRGDMLRNVDGNLYGAWPFVAVVGTVNPSTSYTFTFYANNPIVAPSSEGTYSSVWQLWQNGTWYGSSVTITFSVKNGGGTRPNTPTLTSPANWDYERGGATPQLCASSTSSNIQYDFQIYQGTSTPDSGWIYGNCWTPSPLGPNTFAWHAKVRDISSGLESGWSDGWNFSIASQQLTMDPISFSPPSPSNAEGIYVRSCVHGFGDVNLGLSYEINTATDGSSSGVWHGFSNAGNNCPDINNPSTWGQFPSLQYADGDHLVQATGTGPQGQTMIVQAVYHLNHRRPDRAGLLSPIQNVRVNSTTVNFVWNAAMNAQHYQLIISSNPDLSSPIFNQDIGNVTSYQYTFSQAISPLYWQVISINDIGQNSTDITKFGIDLVPPTASVNILPATTADTTFTVTWSGNDNDAGVEWYNVQYRDGNDPGATWVNWQTNTTAIAALFTGVAGHTYYFRTQAMDNAANLSAYAGGNGDTNTFIDLNSRPQTSWWDTNYSGKRNAIILNNDTQGLPAGYPIHLHFDTSTTPTASDIFSSSLSANPGDDIRIVYQDKTEIPRYLANFSSTQVDIWFDLQASLGSNPATDTTNYQIYYGNANANTPSATINDVIPESTDSNTVGLWHFQEGSGSSISDSSGNGNTGTTSNMGWTNGKFGPAGNFNGTSASVNVGNSSALDPSNLTVEAWVYPTNVGSEQSVARKSTSSSDSGLIYDLLVQGDGVYLRLNGNNGYVRSNTHLQNNQWYHIAGTYDGNTIRVYINGVLDNSVSYNVPLRPSSGNLYIGGNGQDNNEHFYGYIQGVRVSNVVRSSFPYGNFGNTLLEPSTNAGSPVAQQTGTPSLAVQSVNVVPNTDGTNTMVVVVQNQGSVNTENGFATDLYLNHQPTGPGDYTGSVNSWVASPIDSNQNITLATTVSASSNLMVARSATPTETTQTFYVQADSTGALAKYDQSNLTITGPVSVCTASPDTFEGDNSAATAKSITVNGVAQVHNFNTPGDQDWVSFTAKKGATYTINTSNLGPNADTVLALYGTDGATLLASNDDYNESLASQIVWQAPASGKYFLQVTDWSPFISGCGTDYNLSVSQGALITSTPTSTLINKTVKISGKWFAANEPVNLYLDSTSSTPLVSATTGGTGLLATSFTMPQATLGAHIIYAVGQTSQKVAITSIQVLPKIVLSKTSGAQGSNITVTGYGFLGYVQDTSEVVNVYWGSSTGTLLGSSPTNGLGTSGGITFKIPVVPAGTYTLYAVGTASGATATIPFKVTPSLKISPTSGAKGSPATISGTGFGANETVTVKWNCNSSTCTSTTVLGAITTDANGNFNGLSVIIPSAVGVGATYTIGATGGTSNAFAATHYKVTS